MNTILANYETLPELVNGKVIVLSGDTYNIVKPFKDVVIENDFDPMLYKLVVTDRYAGIGYSSKNERDTHITELKLKGTFVPPCRPGDRIHIHSRNGMYTVSSISNKHIIITCARWYEDPFVKIPLSDFKCLAGGINKSYC